MYNQTLVDKVQDVDLRYNVDRRAFEERWQKRVIRYVSQHSRRLMTGMNVGYVTRPSSFY